ncbi:DUF2812 domain-containing protein [Absicoccus intestinalis]|uniref:DUF2812 domain-containing protein n=1 Tax=Absicoccus intestinalis TaxID=2926319 RepID=A0ABU4WM60_9FIRM|nr:DUF2812 domain-containing protein [Absicoccus sp. CLA-KB-P134]MDX8417146.1 DUF2812 domain-containing protein [Absicoccus sp. CLA-KB-P134]
MAEESKQKKKESALEELKRIQEADHAAGIHYNEPELKHFDAQSVFNVDEKQSEKKPERKSAFHLGKRANRNKTTRVQVHSQAFENTSFQIEDVTLAPKDKPRRHQAPVDPVEEVRARQVQQMKESLAHEQDVAEEKVKVWKPKEERVAKPEPVENMESTATVEKEEPTPVVQSETVEPTPVEEVARPEEIEEASEDELIEELAIVDKTEEEKPADVDEKEIESLIQKPDATPDHDDIELVKVEEEKPKKTNKESLEISLDEVLQVVDASKSKHVDLDTSNGQVMNLDEDDDIDIVDVEDTDDATKGEVEDEMDIPVMDMDEKEDQPEPSEKISEDIQDRKAPEEVEPIQTSVPVEPEDEDIEVIDLDEDEEEEDLETEDIPEGDLYEEKKRFLLSEYAKEEDYLEQQSQRGYHYVRRDGKRFVFVKGDPKDYYYLLNYYQQEPSAQTKAQWKRDGWKLLSVSPSKDKKVAGWFVLRNEEQPGEYRKTIDNEEEKYEFFRKYRNSVRSTLFFIFICMACCVVTGVLQVMAQGFLFGIACCVILFIVALIAFITYSRMLRGATKQANLLNARLRLRKREETLDDNEEESDEQLDSEWEKVEEE